MFHMKHINACFILTRNADISSKYRGSDTYSASLTCCLVMVPICIASPRVMPAHITSALTNMVCIILLHLCQRQDAGQQGEKISKEAS
jgi:hypothetical protein